MSQQFERPDAAKEYFAWEKVALDGREVKSPMVVTITAGDWATFPTTPSYVDQWSGQTIVTSGLFHEFNSRVGCLVNDTVTTDTATIACAGRFFAPIKTGETPTPGEPAYWDQTAEKFTLVSAAGLIFCGFFIGTEETLGSGNSRHLIEGDYCELELTPLQYIVP